MELDIELTCYGGPMDGHVEYVTFDLLRTLLDQPGIPHTQFERLDCGHVQVRQSSGMYVLTKDGEAEYRCDWTMPRAKDD